MSKRHYNEFSSRHDYLADTEEQARAFEELNDFIEARALYSTFTVEQLEPNELIRHAKRVAIFFANSLYNNGFINRRYNKYDIEDIASDSIVDVYANFEKLQHTDLSITLHPMIVRATKISINRLRNVQNRHAIIVSDEDIQYLESNAIATLLVANDIDYTQRDSTLTQAYINTLNKAQKRTRSTIEDIALCYANSEAVPNQGRQVLKRFKVNALQEYNRLKEEQEKRKQIKELTKQLREAEEDHQGPILKKLEALYNALDQ